MAIADRTRADLRTALKLHTDSKLTLTADQDYYLNLAELDVFSDWRRFDPGLFRPVQDSVATDANGILLLDPEFTRLELLETSDGERFTKIDATSDLRYSTGFVFLGFDQSAGKRQLKVVRNGAAVASTTLYWYNIAQMLMGSGDTAKSAIPNDFRKLITFKAAFLYYRDKGTAFITSKEDWKRDYEQELGKASSWYKNPDMSPQFVKSLDPDAGDSGLVLRVTPTA